METNIWDVVKENLKRQNPENRNLDVWITNVSLLSADDSPRGRKFRLGVPSALAQYWITHNLLDKICSEISSVYGAPFEIDLVVASPQEQQTLPLSLQEDSPTSGPNVQGLLAPENFNDISSQPVQMLAQTNVERSSDFLNSEYTFSTFMVGKHNAFAHAACFSVAERPGERVNPLFICGPTGMGKTHLLNAVGNYIRSNVPDLRIRYVSAESFMNQCISSIRRQEMDKFKSRYRDQCDVLLMDDIQVLGRGEAVQEEFFHTLNSFFEKRHQVVVASDRMPKDINGLEDRIRTRLEWGVIADIQMPDIETRVAILRYKAERQGIHMSDEAIHFIASISKRSIRELEGNLNKVSMYTNLLGIPITVDIAKQILANHYSEASHITIEDIQKLVTTHYNIRQTDLKSTTRSKPIVVARQVAMYLCRKYLEKSLQDIGRAFGGRDHSTVLNSLERVESQLEKDSDLKKDLDDLQTRIHNMTGL